MAPTPNGKAPSEPKSGTDAPPTPPARAGDPAGPGRDHPAGLRDYAAGDGASLNPADEITLWEGRTHWTHFAGSLAVGLLAVLVISIVGYRFRATAGMLGIWLVLVIACVAVVAARVTLRVLSCHYRLTNQRLFITRGILSQTTDQSELIRVDDVRVLRTLADRLLGLGSVEILSTDLTDRALVIEGVRGAVAIAEHVRANMRVLRKKSLFVEQL